MYQIPCTAGNLPNENSQIVDASVIIEEPLFVGDESPVPRELPESLYLAPFSPEPDNLANIREDCDFGSQVDDEDYFSLPPFDRYDDDFNEDEDIFFDFDHSDQLVEEEEEFQATFREMLIGWVFDYNIAKSAVSALLRILVKITVLSFLPRTYKSLLKTPRRVELEEMKPGKYFHAGLKEGIIESLDNMQLMPDAVSIFVNVDGVPLSESSRSDFWPILGRLYLPTEGKPFEIGIYHGRGKPENFNGFLQRFVDEANDVISNGLPYKGKTISVSISAFVCDLPALASIKYITSFSGYHSCIKCVTQGTYITNRGNKSGGRVTYPELDAELRTDASFRNQLHEEHHVGRSVLEKLPISMTDAFPIDPMHNTFIGVTRKLLHVWYSARKQLTVRFFF